MQDPGRNRGKRTRKISHLIEIEEILQIPCGEVRRSQRASNPAWPYDLFCWGEIGVNSDYPFLSARKAQRNLESSNLSLEPDLRLFSPQGIASLKTPPVYDLSEIFFLSSSLSVSLIALVPSFPCSFWEFSPHNLEQVYPKRIFWSLLLRQIYLGPLSWSSQFLWKSLSLPARGFTSSRSFSRTSTTSETILRWGFLFNLIISSSSLAWVLVSSSSIQIGVLLLPTLSVVLIVGASGEENLTQHNSPPLLMFSLRVFWKGLLSAASRFWFSNWKGFDCCISCLSHFHNVITELFPSIMISIHHLFQDYRHVSSVNLSSSSRLLWFDSRTPSSY